MRVEELRTDYQPVKWQQVWWSSIEFGSSISSGVLDTFLVAFYFFDVLGKYTGPGVVERMFFIGTVVFFGKIIQGLANLPVAQISDRIRTRWGRRRVFVLFGSVPWGLSVFMLFGIPSMFPQPFGDSLILSIAWLAIWYIFYNIMNAAVINPYLAMLPEIAKGSLERTRYQQFRTLFTFLGMVLAAIAWPILGEKLGAPLITFLMILTALIMVKGSREDQNVEPTTISFRESATLVLRNPAFRSYIVTIMGWMAASQMLLAQLPMVVEGIFGIDIDSTEPISWIGIEPSLLMSIVSGIFVITAIIIIPFISKIQQILGKKKSFQLFMILFAIFASSIALLGYLPGTPSAGTDDYYRFLFFHLVISILLTGIPAGGFVVLLYSVFSDVIDNDLYGDRQRRESMYFAVQGVLDWGAASAGALIMGIILAFFGSSDFGGVEDAGILETGSLGIRIVVLTAAVIMLFASTWFRKYPLEE
ncbi:MAG: MFS transporter [Candidatus Heimdallarchaeota archaeon]|nr:MAG: MFS transporter [Candidatus Heimdallarchaeota archaeon]